MSMKSCPCVVCNGSGFASDSFIPRKISKMNRKGKWKVLYQRINCGACNGSGVQVEDSYLDNMINMNVNNVRNKTIHTQTSRDESTSTSESENEEALSRDNNEKKVPSTSRRSKMGRRSSVERRGSMERRTLQLERWIKEKYVSEKCLRLFS